MDKILTIIVAAYNVEKFLRNTLSSCVVDDPFDGQLEVIVVNDGSTDSTSTIAHEFAEKYPKTFRVIDKKNGHYGSCINVGLENATGRYVRILDGDDSYDTSALRDFLRHLAACDVDLVVSDACTVDSDGNVTNVIRYQYPTDRNLTLDETARLDCSAICNSSITYRTQMLREMKYRQMEGLPHTDIQWSMIPMMKVKSVVYVPFRIYRYLVGRDGQSMAPKEVCGQIDKQAKVSLSVYNEYLERSRKEKIENPLFWHQTLLDSVIWISRIYAIGYGDAVPTSNGREYDISVKKLLPLVYEEAAAATTGSFYKFYFVKQWRNSYSRASWQYSVYRLYRRMVATVHRFKR